MKHSVMLDINKCRGCTTCIKHCPTEAIRVRRSKAYIIDERCIDCGECIRVCPYKAKKAVCDSFSMLEDYKYKIALPAPALYGQFCNLDDINYILGGLLEIGFDDVYEVARAAEMLSDLARKEISVKRGVHMPRISSACPAAVRLICLRFPKLIQNVVKYAAPVELAAINARELAAEKTGLDPSEIGVFFISPCPAKVTAAHNPPGLDKAVIDGVFSISELYTRLLEPMRALDKPPVISHTGIVGIGWAGTGGESAALLSDNYVAVDGIENIIKMLGDVEDGKLPELEFVELNACIQGCVGGCLTVENPFTAKMRIKRLMKSLPVSKNKFTFEGVDKKRAYLERELRYSAALRLDPDKKTALELLFKIKELDDALPGLNCGACGAPSCRALAEDVIMGRASADDCIFHMRERMQYMSGTGSADEYMPPPFRNIE